MKFLLINCLNVDEGLRSAENLSEQLGLLYIASSLREHFKDEIELRVEYALTRDMLEEFRPDIVGLSSVSQNYHVAQRYARLSSEHGTPVVVGGVHISTLPHTLTEDMDVGVINEGEDTVVELVEVFKATGSFTPEKMRCIKGIVFRDPDKEGELVHTEFRERLKDLDRLPTPARDLFHHPKRGIFTSRGCPYDCTFCFSKPFWGKSSRYFSPEYVIEELKDIVKKYKVPQISIYDDLFIANKPRFRKIVEYIREAGLHKKVAFNCNVRPNIIDDEIAALLKSMNISHVFLGIESGNERVLKYLKKDACSVEQNQKAIDILRRHGIITYGGFIIGSPDETMEEIMETYGFIKESGIDAFSPLMLTPLPGTPVWDEAKRRGLVSDFMDWSVLREEFGEVQDRHVLMSEVLSRGELIEIYRKFRRLQKVKSTTLALKHPLFALSVLTRTVKRQFQFLKILGSKNAVKEAA